MSPLIAGGIFELFAISLLGEFEEWQGLRYLSRLFKKSSSSSSLNLFRMFRIFLCWDSCAVWLVSLWPFSTTCLFAEL